MLSGRGLSAGGGCVMALISRSTNAVQDWETLINANDHALYAACARSSKRAPGDYAYDKATSTAR